jgi:hypothetical protein
MESSKRRGRARRWLEATTEHAKSRRIAAITAEGLRRIEGPSPDGRFSKSVSALRNA